jgi:hypothetical protein
MYRTTSCVSCGFQEATGIPAPAQAIVFKGAMLPDHVSVRDCGLRDGALVHLVRRNVNIIDTYRKDELRINCRFCHVAGAPVVPRALCPRCGYYWLVCSRELCSQVHVATHAVLKL